MTVMSGEDARRAFETSGRGRRRRGLAFLAAAAAGSLILVGSASAAGQASGPPQASAGRYVVNRPMTDWRLRRLAWRLHVLSLELRRRNARMRPAMRPVVRPVMRPPASQQSNLAKATEANMLVAMRPK